MDDQLHEYRGFSIASKVLERTKKSDQVPRLPLRAVARHGRIRIEAVQPVSGEWHERVRYEIDRLLDPAILRKVLKLN